MCGALPQKLAVKDERNETWKQLEKQICFLLKYIVDILTQC